MQVRPQRLLMVWAVVCLAAAAAAQTPSSVRTAGDAPAPLVVQGLGRATVPVDGLWAFHPGDDLAWAQPSYNDSLWAGIETGKPGRSRASGT
ncbi:MAG TPA: hypothetical protein VHZ09_14175 [Acidobacteriaceae bacterium]|nr:hypothetical protein [Acidobacteriaceae bacterium]